MYETYNEDLQYFPGEDFDYGDPIALQVALEVTKRDMWRNQRAARGWAEEY